MLETSQKNFLTPRGARGASKQGAAGGPVFLRSAFLVFLVIFLQTWAKIDARNLQKNFLTPRGARGDRGDSFLIIYILGIFGDISSNLSLDRCQKPPKKFYDSQGGPGGIVIRGTAGGASFLKIYILCNFGDISSNLSCDRCQKPPKNNFDFLRGQGGE